MNQRLSMVSHHPFPDLLAALCGCPSGHGGLVACAVGRLAPTRVFVSFGAMPKEKRRLFRCAGFVIPVLAEPYLKRSLHTACPVMAGALQVCLYRLDAAALKG